MVQWEGHDGVWIRWNTRYTAVVNLQIQSSYHITYFNMISYKLVIVNSYEYNHNNTI